MVAEMKRIKTSHCSLGKSKLSEKVNEDVFNKGENPEISSYFDKILQCSEVDHFL